MASVIIWILSIKQVSMVQLIQLIQKQWDMKDLSRSNAHIILL